MLLLTDFCSGWEEKSFFCFFFICSIIWKKKKYIKWVTKFSFLNIVQYGIWAISNCNNILRKPNYIWYAVISRHVVFLWLLFFLLHLWDEIYLWQECIHQHWRRKGRFWITNSRFKDDHCPRHLSTNQPDQLDCLREESWDKSQANPV